VIARGLALAALALSLLVPAGSSASPLDIPAAAPRQFRALVRAKLHTSERRHSADTLVELGSQHGYRLTAIGEGNLVAFVVMRGRDFRHAHPKPGQAISQVVTGYVTRGTVTPSRIEGSFGRFGSIALRFHPSGRAAKQDPGRCRGHDRFTIRHGVFVGHVRFTGENRYVTVRAHRAKGRVRTPRHLRCRNSHVVELRARASSAKRASQPEEWLFAEDRRPTDSTGLLMAQEGKVALLLALDEETGGKMAVVRYALAVARRQVFSHDDALTSATLRPPRPFHGKGVYRAAPDGTTAWTGSLSISFPGAPRLPLAGADFATDLEVGF